jgi:adenylosuccinate synthase
VIFEGAQGLGLDQTRGAFPHVTRSNTGLKNVLALAQEAGIGGLDVTYASRAYVTRHGAGPLEHALPCKPHAGVVDATNIDNPWQGSIRFGRLDLDLLAGRILDDLGDARGSGICVRHSLALTCLDQIEGKATYVAADVLRRASPEAMAVEAVEAVRAEGLLLSHGPTRETLMSAAARPALRAA